METNTSSKKDIQIELIKEMLANATNEQVEYFYHFISGKLKHEIKTK